jgi:hypothetical protein
VKFVLSVSHKQSTFVSISEYTVTKHSCAVSKIVESSSGNWKISKSITEYTPERGLMSVQFVKSGSHKQGTLVGI